MAPIRVLIVHDDAAFFERVRQGIVGAFPDAQINGAISAPRALGMAKQQMPCLLYTSPSPRDRG